MFKILPRFLLLISLMAPLSAAAATAQDARNYVDNIAKEALDVIKTAPNKQEKQQKLEQMFVQHVDVPWIGKFVMGRYWRQLSPEQQTRYINQYQQFIVANYTSHFTDYSSGSYHIMDVKNDGENEYTVSMKIEPPDNQPIGVDYRLRSSETGEMKIYDIIIEGVSLITTQRSEFTSVMQNQGIDFLIGQLEKKTQQTHQAS